MGLLPIVKSKKERSLRKGKTQLTLPTIRMCDVSLHYELNRINPLEDYQKECELT